MSDNRTELPEGTDTVISGASDTGFAATGAEIANGDDLIIDASSTGTGSDLGGGASTGTSQRLGDRVRSGRDKLAGQAGDKARGFVSQGLERGAEALANVGRLVGDTAPGLEERLGSEYGDYARRAAGAIENAANSIAAKDPDELIEDTRNFVRASPGVAVAGAAIIGFAVARLIKGGLSSDDDDDRGNGRRSKA